MIHFTNTKKGKSYYTDYFFESLEERLEEAEKLTYLMQEDFEFMTKRVENLGFDLVSVERAIAMTRDGDIVNQNMELTNLHDGEIMIYDHFKRSWYNRKISLGNMADARFKFLKDSHVMIYSTKNWENRAIAFSELSHGNGLPHMCGLTYDKQWNRRGLKLMDCVGIDSAGSVEIGSDNSNILIHRDNLWQREKLGLRFMGLIGEDNDMIVYSENKQWQSIRPELRLFFPSISEDTSILRFDKGWKANPFSLTKFLQLQKPKPDDMIVYRNGMWTLQSNRISTQNIVDIVYPPGIVFQHELPANHILRFNNTEWTIEPFSLPIHGIRQGVLCFEEGWKGTKYLECKWHDLVDVRVPPNRINIGNLTQSTIVGSRQELSTKCKKTIIGDPLKPVTNNTATSIGSNPTDAILSISNRLSIQNPDESKSINIGGMTLGDYWQFPVSLRTNNRGHNLVMREGKVGVDRDTWDNGDSGTIPEERFQDTHRMGIYLIKELTKMRYLNRRLIVKLSERMEINFMTKNLWSPVKFKNDSISELPKIRVLPSGTIVGDLDFPLMIEIIVTARLCNLSEDSTETRIVSMGIMKNNTLPVMGERIGTLRNRIDLKCHKIEKMQDFTLNLAFNNRTDDAPVILEKLNIQIRII